MTDIQLKCVISMILFSFNEKVLPTQIVNLWNKESRRHFICTCCRQRAVWEERKCRHWLTSGLFPADFTKHWIFYVMFIEAEDKGGSGGDICLPIISSTTTAAIVCRRLQAAKAQCRLTTRNNIWDWLALLKVSTPILERNTEKVSATGGFQKYFSLFCSLF